MKQIQWSSAGLIFLLLLTGLPALSQTGFFPEVDALSQNYVKKPKNKGLSIGIVYKGQARFTGYGRLSKDKPESPGEHTIFELGAVSSVFTTTLLAMMEDRQQLLAGTTIQQVLPQGYEAPVFTPERCVATAVPGAPEKTVVTCAPDPFAAPEQITLCQLAYHHSGLTCSCGELYKWNPFINTDFDPEQPKDVPSAADFFREAEGFLFTNRPGEKFTFSNIGIAYLGNLLASYRNVTFGVLLSKEITQPLGMEDTRIKLLPQQETRLATGHNAKGQATAPWNFQGMAPAAGIKSSAFDLVQFLQVNLKPGNVLSEGAALLAQQSMAAIHFPGRPHDTMAAYGWLVTTDAANRVVHWINGGTAGFRAFMGFDRNRQIGVVVLSNSADDVTELGMSIIGVLQAKQE